MLKFTIIVSIITLFTVGCTSVQVKTDIDKRYSKQNSASNKAMNALDKE